MGSAIRSISDLATQMIDKTGPNSDLSVEHRLQALANNLEDETDPWMLLHIAEDAAMICIEERGKLQHRALQVADAAAHRQMHAITTILQHAALLSEAIDLYRYCTDRHKVAAAMPEHASIEQAIRNVDRILSLMELPDQLHYYNVVRRTLSRELDDDRDGSGRSVSSVEDNPVL